MSKTAWHKTEKQALEMLQQLLRLDTTNPPGNERIATDYIRPILERDGIDPIVVESAQTRANLVARIKGRDAQTLDSDPLMISFHTDVVPAEIKSWTRAPFGGEIHDGCVWGRGALDMKNKAAMDIAVFTALRRSGARPDRDLILAAVADEEAGSDLGAKYL